MNQDETFVKNKGQRGGSNPYSRSGNSGFGGQVNGTYVPGMQENAPGVNNELSNPMNNTPVVGFLYSISRKGIGEYWPLHLGTNTIGRAADCDIVLHERSVSEHHATLSIKQMKSTGKLIASIRDIGSKNGMYLNDEELDYENHACKLHDKITIGTCYKLLLILIDAEDYGLSVAENFMADEEAENDFMGDNRFGQFAGGDATQSRYNLYDADNRNVDTGTVDLNGQQPTKPGGTKYM